MLNTVKEITNFEVLMAFVGVIAVIAISSNPKKISGFFKKIADIIKRFIKGSTDNTSEKNISSNIDSSNNNTGNCGNNSGNANNLGNNNNGDNHNYNSSNNCGNQGGNTYIEINYYDSPQKNK